MPLATLLPLLDLPDLSFVSLQHEVREEDMSILQDHSHDVTQIGGEFRDFADTAAVVCCTWTR